MADLISTPEAGTASPIQRRPTPDGMETKPMPVLHVEVTPEIAALREFVEGAAPAFAALTERYAGLVYSAALRRTGSPEVAEEVAQNVFTILARKAPRLLRENVPLAPWLHRAAVLEAAQARRREHARQRAMKAYMSNLETHPASPPPDVTVPEALLPELDEGLNRLPGPDRELLLARYFEDRTYRELAAATGRTEAALMQQHHRALEKLARFFKRRGHAVTVTALAAGLSGPLTTSAPAGLAAGCAAAATSAAAAVSVATSGAGIFSTFQLALVMQIKTHLLSAAALLLLLAGTASFLAGRWQRDRAQQTFSNLSTSGSGQKQGASGTRNSPGESADLSSILADLPIPSAEEVLAAEGRERVEKLALWVTTAAPAALADMLEKLSAPDETNTQRTEKELILQRWVELDQKGAFAASRKFDGSTWIACEAWGRSQPREAWAGTGKMDPFEKAYVLKGIIATNPRLAEEIIAGSSGLDTMRITELQGNLAASLARKDPRLGWEYAIKTGAWMIDEAGLGLWIRENPEEALSFARSRPNAYQQRQAMGELLEKLGSDQPEKIESLLASLPEGRLKWKLTAQRASDMAGGDFDTAMAFAQNPATSLIARSVITESLAERWAESKPEVVLKMLRGLDWSLSGEEISRPEILTAPTSAADAAPGAGESKAAAALGKLAGTGHLTEALEVAGSVPPGFLQDQALSGIAKGWPAAQVMELSEWLTAQDSPSVRETGARRIVSVLLKEKNPDFESAATWAATLPLKGPPEDSWLFDVVRRWRDKDSAGAAAGIKTLTMPDSLRAALEKPVKP